MYTAIYIAVPWHPSSDIWEPGPESLHPTLIWAHRSAVEVQQAVRDVGELLRVAWLRDVLHQVSDQRLQLLRVPPAWTGPDMS